MFSDSLKLSSISHSHPPSFRSCLLVLVVSFHTILPHNQMICSMDTTSLNCSHTAHILFLVISLPYHTDNSLLAPTSKNKDWPKIRKWFFVFIVWEPWDLFLKAILTLLLLALFIQLLLWIYLWSTFRAPPPGWVTIPLFSPGNVDLLLYVLGGTPAVPLHHAAA